MSYKDEIEKCVNNAGDGFFAEPQEGIREYPLFLGYYTGKADFCWRFLNSGRLFIEDEDDDSQRALNNLIKYWEWCEINPQIKPILFIHILGFKNRLNVRNAMFLKEKMESALTKNHFYYRAVFGFVGQNQHTTDACWIKDLKHTLQEMLPLLKPNNKS